MVRTAVAINKTGNRYGLIKFPQIYSLHNPIGRLSYNCTALMVGTILQTESLQPSSCLESVFYLNQFSSKVYSYHIFINNNLSCSQLLSCKIKYTTSFYYLLKAPDASVSLNTTCHERALFEFLFLKCVLPKSYRDSQGLENGINASSFFSLGLHRPLLQPHATPHSDTQGIVIQFVGTIFYHSLSV